MRLIVMGVAACCLFSVEPATAASPFDGVYTGARTWAGNGNRRCTNARDAKLRVHDGKLNYRVGDERVTATVAADGSFSAQSGQRYIQGKISGDHLNATTSGKNCNYMWDLQRS